MPASFSAPQPRLLIPSIFPSVSCYGRRWRRRGAVKLVRYLFEDYSLDTDRRELLRGTAAVAVEPQVFDLLVHLIRHRDRVVGKNDLLDAVWHGRAISESA